MRLTISPLAALNSLRFGELTAGSGGDVERTKFLVRGVVRGIGDYGNSFGVPTVGGEVYFDKCYQGNPLVNAMAVGIVEHGKTKATDNIAAGKGIVFTTYDTLRGGAQAKGDNPGRTRLQQRLVAIRKNG